MSPKSKQQNELIKDERREQLLLAALKVFSHRGLAPTKIGDIAAAAGMSHGLVYHYFSSKDDIFTELVRRATSGSADALLQIEKIPMEPLEKIRLVASSILKSIGETADTAYYFFLMIQATMSDTEPDEVKEILRNSNVPAEVLLRIVQEGQAKGQIREGDPVEYVTTFYAAIEGLAICKIAGGDNYIVPDGSLLVRMFEKPC